MATEVSSLPATAVFPKSAPANATAGASLFSPGIDLLAVGGLSLIIYGFFTCTNHIAQLLPVATFALIMNYFVNYPHFSATYVRAYGSWDTIKRYYGVCLITPLILLVVSGLALYHESWANWFSKAYLLSSGYHFSGQTYGIALIFAGKAKIMLSRWEKYVVMAPIYTSYLYLLGQKEVSTAPTQPVVMDFRVPPLGLPEWASPLTILLFGLGLGVYLTWTLFLYYRHQQVLPTICHVVVGSQMIWFVWGANNEAYNLLVPLFHCLQYLLITTFFYFKSVLSGTAGATSMVHVFATTSFWRYYGLLIVLGIVLFELVYRLIGWVGLDTLGLAMVVGLSFLNLHHFLMDGRIWRLRKPEVRRVILQPAVG